MTTTQKWDKDAHYAVEAGRLSGQLGISADDVYALFCERAAIRHFDGKLSVDEAEQEAWKDTLRKYQSQGVLL